jgi:superfamily II helicase
VLKGEVRNYDEVYSSYEKSYRESLDRMNLPSKLEDIVKQYFSEMDPKGVN